MRPQWSECRKRKDQSIKPWAFLEQLPGQIVPAVSRKVISLGFVDVEDFGDLDK